MYSPSRPVHLSLSDDPSEVPSMPRREWSRRDVLRQCLAAGVLVVPAGWGEAEVLHAWLDAQAERQPTAHVEMGPFYKKRAPATTTLRSAGDPGMPLTVSGRVITVHGERVPGATMEIWQADHGGLFTISRAIAIARPSRLRRQVPMRSSRSCRDTIPRALRGMCTTSLQRPGTSLSPPSCTLRPTRSSTAIPTRTTRRIR